MSEAKKQFSLKRLVNLSSILYTRTIFQRREDMSIKGGNVNHSMHVYVTGTTRISVCQLR